jgi:hypothetical protein
MCEHFDETRGARCRAVAGTLIPSLFEREQFCRTENHGRCPTQRLYRIRGSKLSQEAYYALWIPFQPQPLVDETTTPPPGLRGAHQPV